MHGDGRLQKRRTTAPYASLFIASFAAQSLENRSWPFTARPANHWLSVFPFHRHEVLPAGIAGGGPSWLRWSCRVDRLKSTIWPPIPSCRVGVTKFCAPRLDDPGQSRGRVLEAGQVFRVDLGGFSVALPSMLPAGSRELICTALSGRVFHPWQQNDGYCGVADRCQDRRIATDLLQSAIIRSGSCGAGKQPVVSFAATKRWR